MPFGECPLPARRLTYGGGLSPCSQRLRYTSLLGRGRAGPVGRALGPGQVTGLYRRHVRCVGCYLSRLHHQAGYWCLRYGGELQTAPCLFEGRGICNQQHLGKFCASVRGQTGYTRLEYQRAPTCLPRHRGRLLSPTCRPGPPTGADVGGLMTSGGGVGQCPGRQIRLGSPDLALNPAGSIAV